MGGWFGFQPVFENLFVASDIRDGVFVELREEGGCCFSQRVLQFADAGDTTMALSRWQALDQSKVFSLTNDVTHDDLLGRTLELDASAASPAGFQVAESA